MKSYQEWLVENFDYDTNPFVPNLIVLLNKATDGMDKQRKEAFLYYLMQEIINPHMNDKIK